MWVFVCVYVPQLYRLILGEFNPSKKKTNQSQLQKNSEFSMVQNMTLVSSPEDCLPIEYTKNEHKSWNTQAKNPLLLLF